LLLALLGYYKERRDNRNDERLRKRKLLQALKMEIDLNLKGLIESNGIFPNAEAFDAVISSSRDYRPLIMLHNTADIYRANTQQLSDLETKLAGEIISFYQTLNFVKDLSKVTDALAYVTISDDSRKAVPERIRKELGAAIKTGKNVSAELDKVISRYI
jgi:hypothetical protein